MEHNHDEQGESPKHKSRLDRAIDRLEAFFPDKSGRYIFALIVCLLLILIFVTGLRIVDYKPHAKTSLDTKITLMDKDFTLSHGCIAYLEGTVANTGAGEANDVTVKCTAKNNNMELRSSELYLGPVPYSSERKFNMRIDYGCFDGGLMNNLYFECEGSCGDGSCNAG